MSALAALKQSDFGPSSQLLALVYAVRWSAGVRELESLGGERWLEMAAGPVSFVSYGSIIKITKMYRPKNLHQPYCSLRLPL